MPLDIEKIEEIIISSNFDQLKGEFECEWLDCKSQPYILSEDKGKREICKDITSFANVKGGYILIGIKTKKTEGVFGEVIDEIKPFEEKIVNIEKYYAIIKEWIYPDIRELTIKWKPIIDNGNEGIVIISVPKQDEKSKPFLINKILDENKRSEIMFGYVLRKGDISQPQKIQTIHFWLNRGIYYDENIKLQFDNLETLIKERIDTDKITVKDKKALITERINKAVIDGDISGERRIELSIFSEQAIAIKAWGSSSCKIKDLLENPVSLRTNGWDLRTLSKAKFIVGELYRVMIGGYKIVDVYRDGTLIFIGTVNEDFLLWNTPRDMKKINSLSMIELIYNFCVFYRIILGEFITVPKNVIVNISLKYMKKDNVDVCLSPYDYTNSKHAIRTNPAPEDFFEKVIFTEDIVDSQKIAYDIIKEIYFWFNHEENVIPYVISDHDIRKIDTNKIKDIR